MKSDELCRDLLAGRLAPVAVDDLAERPGVALCAAADHDGGRSRRGEHRLRAGARDDVPGGDHRHVDQRDELGGERMVGRARVHLLCGAGMQREGGRAGVDEERAHVEAGAVAVAQAAPHLDRDGQVDRLGDGLHDRARAVRVVEERRAGARLRHLPHRAAEVDVDQVRARRLYHACCFGHRPGLGAEDLDRERVLVGGHPQVPERLLVAVLDPGAADHLGAHETRSEAPSLTAKRLHADAGHRRQHDTRRDLDAGDPPALTQVDGHGERMVLTVLTQSDLRANIRARVGALLAGFFRRRKEP